MAVSNLSNLKNVGFKFVCVAQTSLSQLNLSVDDGEPHPLSSKTGFGPTLRYIGDIFPNNSWITFHSHIEEYISELLALHYRFNKFISVLPDTFLPQSWSRLELAWSSAWWRRPPPPLACWCRCHPSRSNGCPGCPPADRTGVFVFVFLCDILQVTCGWWHWST